MRRIILETAVQDDKLTQSFDSESLLMGDDHSQKVKTPPIKSDSESKDCVNLSSSSAVSRIIPLLIIPLYLSSMFGLEGSVYGLPKEYSSMSCDEEECCEEDLCKEKLHSLIIRGAAVYPSGNYTRKIYDRVWPQGSLEYNFKFDPNWAFFINGAISYRKGRSIGLENRTSLTLVPLTAGFKLLCNSSSIWHPYLGVGIGVAFAHIHNHSDFVIKHADKFGFASLFHQAGIEFDLDDDFFIDFLTAYRWNWFNFNKRRHRQTGGVEAGLGVGVRF